MANESFDMPMIAGTYQQEREYYLRMIVNKFPERATDSSLLYGDPKLEFLRLANEGLIELPGSGGSVEILGQYELMPYVNMGDSWADPNRVNITTKASPSERLAKRLSMGDITHRGFSSRTVEDLANIVLGGSNRWVPRTKALVTVTSCHLNDTKYLGTNDDAKLSYKFAWRALLSSLTADVAIGANSEHFTYSANWTQESTTGATTAQAANNSTGGKRFKSTVVGSYAVINVTGPNVDIFAVARTEGAGILVATNANGTAEYGRLDLTQPVAQETPAVLKLRNLGSGTKSLRLAFHSGTSMTIDSYRIPIANPIPIVLVPAPDVQNGGGNTVPAGNAIRNYNDAQAAAKTWMKEVADEFPSVTICDLNAYGFDKVEDFYSDLRHLNDRGAVKWADAVAKHLASIGFSKGLNTLTTDPAAYVLPVIPNIPTGGQRGSGAGAEPTPDPTPVKGEFIDLFDREDYGTGLGDLYLETGGRWGIKENKAYRVTGGNTQGYATIKATSPNGTVSTKIATIDSTYSGGLVLRTEDDNPGANGYLLSWRRNADLLFYTLFIRVGGVHTPIKVSNLTPSVGDVVVVSMQDNNITVNVNGTVIIEATDGTYSSNTRHGFYANGTVGAANEYNYLRIFSDASKTPEVVIPPLNPGVSAFEDTFDRQDSINGLGSSWNETNGKWGIYNGEAYRVNGSSAQGFNTVNTNVSDALLETKFTMIDGTYSGGLIFRTEKSSPGNNGYLLSLRGSAALFEYTIFKRTNGVNAVIKNTGVTPKAGDVVRVGLSGSTITLNVNGTIVASVDDSSFNGTSHGLFLNTASGAGVTRFDYFQIKQLA